MQEKNISKVFFWIILGAMIVASYLILKDYIPAILSSFVLAYLLLPVQEFLSRRINRKIAAFLIVAGIVLILGVALYFLADTLITQADQFVSAEKIGQISEFFSSTINSFGINITVAEISSRISSITNSLLIYVIRAIPHMVVSLTITFFITFFILVGWKKISADIRALIPFRDKERILQKFSKTTRNIVFGFLLVAIIEFIISLIGFSIAGLRFSIFLALLIGIAAFLPIIGPASVWVPAFIIQILSKNFFSAGVVLITGLIITVFIDHFLAQILVGKRAELHPVIVLLGILGGVPIFGVLGFIIGPIILSFVIDIMQENHRHNQISDFRQI
jgi:predicted PurR-regulated permease PerM